MGVGPHPKNFPLSTWDEIMEGYQMAGQWGEVCNYWDSVPWYEEEDMLVGNATTRATIKALYFDTGMVPVFQTNVWDILTRPGYGFGAWLDVPSNLDPNITMADTTFRARWVDHVRAIAEEWQMEYYCLGNEVNSYHGWHAENAADFEANFLSLMAECYAAIKEVSPDTKVVITFRLLELYHYDNLEMLELFDDTMCDILAFTSYPSRTGDYDTPADLPDDYYYRIADHTDTMPLAIAELGWTTHTDYGGDEEEQAEFLAWFLNNTKDIPWEYVQWLELHDLRPEGSSTSHAQTVGLLRNDGTPKPAWDLWKAAFNLSYSREWDHIPRSPIWTVGNDNFTLDKGVTSGSGTPDDPYVIEGWDIDGSVGRYCINVWSATVHFVVRNNLLHGIRDRTTGAQIIGSTNGTIQDNVIGSHRRGVFIDEYCTGIRVDGNAFIDNKYHAEDRGADTAFNVSTTGNYWDDYHITVSPIGHHDGTTWVIPYPVDGDSGAVDRHPLVHRPGHVPVPLEDHSSPSATTGDPFTMSVFSPEEGEFSTARVYYWKTGVRHQSDMMMLDASWGSLWMWDDEVPSHSMEPFIYLFVMRGPSGNLTFSNVTHVPVVDDDPPELLFDITSEEAEPGGDLTFEVEVTDNIGVDGVWVEHWYGDGDPINATMEETVKNRWAHTITVERTLEALHYILHFTDVSGNWNSSEIETLALGDATPPVFVEDLTPANGTTGDPALFQVEVTDDIGVHNVTVEYWLSGFPYLTVNDSMEADGDTYTFLLSVPDELVGTVAYRFHAMDTSGNNATSEVGGIAIEDNDPPEITVVMTLPTTVNTGESYEVTVNVFDNLAVWSATLVMSLDTGDGEPIQISQYLQPVHNVSTYSGTVLILTDHVGTLSHYIIVTDHYDNSVSTIEATSQVVDTIPPEMDFLIPLTAKVGQDLFIEVEASDNIGVTEVRWDGLPFEAEGMSANGSIDKPGEYEVTVTVRDAAGNEASESFKIFVEDDVSATTVMLQVAIVLVLVVVALIVVKMLLDKRRRESSGDPELEEPPVY
jgi:hypothetical protein